MIYYRQATAGDFDLTLRIKHNSLKPYIEKIWGWDDAVQFDYHKKEFNPITIRIVLNEKHLDVGYVDTERKSNTIFIANILIDKQHQGKGIGRQILKDIIDDAEKESRTVELQVFKINHRAKKLYESVGFKTVAETDLHFRMVHVPNNDY